MRSLLPFALLPLLLALTPAADAAACGVSAARATYETPEVQVFQKRHKLYACARETGRQRVIGVFANDGMGSDEGHFVYGVVGARWLHSGEYATFAESSDYRRDDLLDLRTGRRVSATVSDDETLNEVVAVPGALVQASDSGVVARFTDGHQVTLDPERGEALAASGARIYWRTEAGPRSAVLTLPAAAPASALPRAHRTAGCAPRTGARLVVTDGLVVVTLVGEDTYACRKGRARKVGVVSAVTIVSDREVAYTRSGFTGVLNVASGKRRELDGPGPVASS